jgi:two-component system, chemotaxis family, protein-glutamate methylesterase/glutaminase
VADFDIVVIGASAGGVGSLQRVVEHIQPDFPAAILIALHLPDGVRSMLPQILERAGNLPAGQARDGDRIEPGRIYVAPGGFHLTVMRGRVSVTRGAREHGHRPAIDPLFRSAAVAYGRRAVGVILSGSLHDGTVGLREIKRAGGVAIVQDPSDTEWPSMPLSALHHVAVDHTVPAAQIGTLLQQLVMTMPRSAANMSDRDENILKDELRELTMHQDERDHPGEPSPYSCPECGGVLWELRDGELLRFRCRVGHAYTSETLTTEQALTVEHALWSALRALEEHAAVRRRMAERAMVKGKRITAERYRQRARELDAQAEQVRGLVLAGVGAADAPADEESTPEPTPEGP